MKLQEQLQSLRTADAALAEQIAGICPADFDEERVFQKSWQKLEQRTGMAVSRPRAGYYRIAGLAACFLLTVGLGVGVWSHQQQITPQPPQIPVPVTETTTAGAVHESTPSTTAAKTTTAQHTMPATTAASTLQMTEAPSTEAVPAPTEAVPAAPEETAPELPAVIETEVPAIQTTDAPTEPPTALQTEAQPETVTEETPEPAAETLRGFKVMQYKDFRQVICMDGFPEPDGELNDYTVEGDSLTLLGTADEESTAPVRTYEIEQNGKTFTVTQQEYAAFVLNVEEGELIDIGVSRVHGFFWLRDEHCTLYWFCEGEGFCVSGDAADLGSLLAIVRGFTPAA